MQPSRARSDRATRPALFVAAALFSLALPREAPGPEPCPTPKLVGPAEVRCQAGTPALPLGLAPAALLFDERLDLNRAPAATLEVLPGVGPARARAIVSERARGAFCAPGDLLRVRGIGPMTLDRVVAFVATPAAPGC